MVLIIFENCGQSFDRDVGIYDITRDDLEASIARCRSVEDIDELCELVDGPAYDLTIYDNISLFEDWLSHDRDDVYLYLNNGDDWLIYFGPDEHFAAVVGSIVAVQHGKGHLPEDLE